MSERFYANPDNRIRKSARVVVWGTVAITILTFVMSNANPSSLITDKRGLWIAAMAVLGFLAFLGVVLAYGCFLPARPTAIYTIANDIILFIVADLITDNAFFAFIVYACVLAFFLYYDKWLMRIPAIAIFAVGTITRLGDLFGLSGADKVLSAAGIFFNLIFLISAICISKLTTKFNNDIFGTMDDAADKQKETMNVLSEVLGVVKTETSSVSDELNDLNESSNHIAESIKNISEGTKLTCESIEQQSTMTGNIQNLIDTTAGKAQSITEITGTVKNSIVEGNGLADGLSNLSEEMSKINEVVTSAMAKLKKSASEMQSVVDAIASVSGQTTLLSLNASIEAARAGDAGRGFAVVAEEIRQLAVQTKESTESIKQLIADLENDATAASDAVERSVSAAKEQKDMIAQVNSKFDSIDSQMGQLSDEVGGISGSINELVTANQTIIDAVSQLSAVSEEVTASTEDVLAAAENNKVNVEKALTSIISVVETTKKAD